MHSRYCAAVLVFGLSFPLAASAQQVPAPSFEVATIKPVDPAAPMNRVGIGYTPDGIDAEFVTVAILLQNAYGFSKFSIDDQIVNLPDWAKTQRYNVQARLSPADAEAMKKLSPPERRERTGPMLQTLLAERFHLKLHPGNKQLPVYELIVAKSGLKIAPVPPASIEAPGPDDKPFTKGSFVLFQRDKATVQEYSMQQLAEFFSRQAHELGRLVLDKTGLPGVYTFTLNWSPNTSFIVGPGGTQTQPVSADAPSLFAALQEIGLRLQPATGTVDTLIVDHLDQPSAN